MPLGNNDRTDALIPDLQSSENGHGRGDLKKAKRYFPFLVLLLLMVISGCGDRGPVKRSWGKMKSLENIVGNMNDISYSSGRTQEPRPNALNEPVSITDFEGNFDSWG